MSAALGQARQACAAGWFEPATLTSLAAGRINDSYRVGTEAGYECVLQAINERVFAAAPELVEQLARVVAHLNQQHAGWVPNLLPTHTGMSFLRFDGRIWRLWQFIPGEALQPATCAPGLLLERLEAAARAFATTQVLLESLPGERLRPAIAHYRDMKFLLDRFDALTTGISANWRQRVAAYREQSAVLSQADGYVHGDCKPDNLLFEPQAAGIAAVLDLDTVMWGNRALDFGDLVRSSVWQEERFELPLFSALVAGFVQGQSPSAKPCSAEQLLHAPVFVSFMLSLRYLLDHVQGDREFKVSHAGENLARAERQFQRTVALRAAHEEMRQVIARYL